MDDEWRPYEASVMFVDPSGEGADETAWAVVKILNGMLFVVHVGGQKGTVEERMLAAANAAKQHAVGKILIEPNYAGDVWMSAFLPIIRSVWKDAPAAELADWAKTQKEVRIIDTLEPALGTHRLVVHEDVARDEVLMFQLTHITRERGSLKHDDRLDALAGAVAHFTKSLGLDSREEVAAMRERELEEELEDFIETASFGAMRRGRGRRRADGYRPEVAQWNT